MWPSSLMLALTLFEMVGFLDNLLLGCGNLLGLCQELFLDVLPVTLCPVVSFGKGLGGATQGLHPGLFLVVLVLGLAASCGYSQGFKPVIIGIVSRIPLLAVLPILGIETQNFAASALFHVVLLVPQLVFLQVEFFLLQFWL